METKKYQLFYFSGTGNTLLLVEKAVEMLKNNNAEVIVERIEDNPVVDPNTSIIFAFPIACFSTYPIVWKFIENLPQSKIATKVNVMYDMAGRSFNFASLLHKTFRKKGYAPQSLGIIIMPSNITKEESTEDKHKTLFDKAFGDVETFVNNVKTGHKNWKQKGLVTGLYNRMVQNMNWFKTMKSWQPTLDESKCTKCGICAELCPTKSIEMNEYPIHKDTCQICLRCIGVCPMKALNLGKTKNIPYCAVQPEKFRKL